MIEKIKYLKHIPFYKEDIIIFGSSVLIAHGINIVNNDIDVIVKPEKLDLYLKTRGIQLNRNESYNYINKIELYYALDIINKTYNQINSNADIIDGYTFINLSDLKLLYMKLGRNKDKEKIVIINSLLQN